MSTEYEDILHLPHPVSSRRRHMTLAERAAQFAPFAALTGFEAAIAETGRTTKMPVELGDDLQNRLDRKQQMLLLAQNTHAAVAITHYLPDERKEGGAYIQTVGHLKRVEPENDQIILTDGTCIPMHYIISLVDASEMKDYWEQT